MIDMSVQILENEVVIRIPIEKYTDEVKKFFQEIDYRIVNESEYFFGVEAGSEFEALLLEVKRERKEYMKPYLDRIKHDKNLI